MLVFFVISYTHYSKKKQSFRQTWFFFKFLISVLTLFNRLQMRDIRAFSLWNSVQRLNLNQKLEYNFVVWTLVLIVLLCIMF